MISFTHWVPAAFCAVLCAMAMSMQIGTDNGAWKPAFYSFLPMCFFFGLVWPTTVHLAIVERVTPSPSPCSRQASQQQSTLGPPHVLHLVPGSICLSALHHTRS